MMFQQFYFLQLLFFIINGDPLYDERIKKPDTLEPRQNCCAVPELRDTRSVAKCSSETGPCNDVRCIFQKSGFMSGHNTLNKEAYRAHLRKLAQKHRGWDYAIKTTIWECVDKEIPQYLMQPCKAFDVFSCTGNTLLRNCPPEALRC